MPRLKPTPPAPKEPIVEPVRRAAHTVEEAAQALRVSRSYTYQLIRDGKLRTVKAGRRRLVPAEALAECLQALGVPA